MSLGMPREQLALCVPSFSRGAGNQQSRRADGREGLLHVFLSPDWTMGHVQIRYVNRICSQMRFMIQEIAVNSGLKNDVTDRDEVRADRIA